MTKPEKPGWFAGDMEKHPGSEKLLVWRNNNGNQPIPQKPSEGSLESRIRESYCSEKATKNVLFSRLSIVFHHRTN